MLKEEWIDNPNTETDILSYILQARDRLETCREIMEQNAKIVQKKQKEYYDQRAKKTKLDPGDNGLLLLPSSTKKFLAQWQGPYSVTRRVGKVNYEIEMPDNGGRKQVFHVNYLGKFHERETEIHNAAIEKVEDIEHYQWNEDQQLHFGEQLTTDQKEMIEEVLKLFPKATKRTPGKTHKISHKIRTTNYL